MRWRPLIWPVAGLLFLAMCWQWSNGAPVGFLDATGSLETRDSGVLATTGPGKAGQRTQEAFLLRLRNTPRTVGELVRSEAAILLENALLDTTQSMELAIPESLRLTPDAGSYIVQSRGPPDPEFRSFVVAAGGSIVSYIPNNAYLVRATADRARAMAQGLRVQAVLPYEPYFKLKPSLLRLVLEQEPPPGEDAATEAGQGRLLPSVPADQVRSVETPLELNLLLFADAELETRAAMGLVPTRVLSEFATPFGPVLKVACPRALVPALARLSGVQELELSHRALPAMDLGRAVSGLATNATTPFNYLDLTGSNVVVHVLDTGVDALHPDLSGRIVFDEPGSGSDANGHGTHVAGIIAGDGVSSLSVTGAPGSVMPPAPFQFRGAAPRAKVYSIALDTATGGSGLEGLLETAAAHTNAFIANNSWLYEGDNDYDLAAAVCDAAVRDALPARPGSQPLLSVFAAGNGGRGSADGTGGVPGTIQSPATAKNVITVGAAEKQRSITNATWSCPGSSACETNLPWLSATDSTNQVAAFSARGNVGIGTEGESGRLKPDLVAPGTFVVAARSTQWDYAAYYAITNSLFTDSPDTNYSQVLRNLNESIGPLYRFESGTSLAAAEVSGTLALMQEFFEQRLGRTNSPALMKALLINGARSVAPGGISTGAATNSQGWGLLHLPNSLPSVLTNLNPASSSMFYFDQNAATALATGQSQTRCVTVNPAARALPLRFTLVWTDPPANPVAGLKLVNDLDLIVTNLENGMVYFGNDLPPGGGFNSPWDARSDPNLDRVNNVETVALAAPLADSYSVTVRARQVNVNALTASAANLVQDYALVIASGDGEVPSALTMAGASIVSGNAPTVTVLANQFELSTVDYGCVLWQERVGSGAPYCSTNSISLGDPGSAMLAPGTTNQWHFYVLTNDTRFTNAAFAVFAAPSLSFPDPGRSTTNPGALSLEADVDLYVSSNPALTNLGEAALSAAAKSLGRGGAETVLLTHAASGVYYLGVKCESQSAAEYNLLAIFSELPFAASDGLGNQMLRGIPAPAAIPESGFATVMGISPEVFARRVIVTNAITHPATAELQGILMHGAGAVVLHNHSGGASGAVVYDDSSEGDLPGSRPSDGPGSLQDFAGCQGAGQWLLTMSTTNRPGTNDSLWIYLESEQDPTGNFSTTILPGACRRDFILLSPAVTNLSTTVNVLSGTGPVTMQLCPVEMNSSNCPVLVLGGAGATGSRTVDNTSVPPIDAGVYELQLWNPGPDPVAVSVSSSTALDPRPPEITQWTSTGLVAIADDAVSVSTISVTNVELVRSVDVGVRINHPRISDLALRLVSPSGRRVLLQENRGGSTLEGEGVDTLITNITTVSWSGGPEASTNVLETGQTQGTVTIDYNFYSLPDEMHVYYEGGLLFDSGFVTTTDIVTTNVSYGPGSSTALTIVMNPGGNPDTNTVWYYRVTSTRMVPLPLTFTENTNLTTVPIKFAPQPLTNINYIAPGSSPAAGIFYLPERSLDAFADESACGPWTLEIHDTQAGATNPTPTLVMWRLGFQFKKSVSTPITLGAGVALTNLLGPGQKLWFAVDAPAWSSFATNRLVLASAPVDVSFSSVAPGVETNFAEVTLLAGCRWGTAVLQTNGTPALRPGSRYFLGVQNTNSATVTFALEIDFDVNTVVTLENGFPYAATNRGPALAADYYRFVVSTNAARAQFEIYGLAGDLTLLARKDLPLPSLSRFDFESCNPWTNDELIVVYDFSSPVALSAGEWYLSVVSVTGNPASYTILATEFPGYATNLVITERSVTNGSFCLTWTSVPGVHYVVEAKASLLDPDWVTVSPTLTATETDYLLTYCVPLPSLYQYFQVREGLALTTPPLLITSISSATNRVLIQGVAPAGTRLNVQWIASLAAGGWSSFTNLLSATNGTFQFVDDGSQSGGLGSTRFYRLLEVP